MLRSIWQRAKERVWNAVTSLWRTQEEIDEYIYQEFIDQGYTVESNPANVPGDGKWRNREFWYPDDAIKYAGDAGIPPSCVYVIPFEDWDDEGNTMYKLYILEDTP